jgi:selenide, water dikinase
VLGDLPVQTDDRVLVDYRTADDAGVYRWDGNRALVQTVDFFTPIVDDPFAYGQIAAANSLSDVYAMGGRPLTALAIAGFPKDLDREVLKQIFAGGLAKLTEAGVALLGGHTVQDSEVKFGYAVTGEVDPASIWSNAGAKPGDVLILTKPLGTGVIATALKFGRAPAVAVESAIQSMLELNRAACDVLRGLPQGSVHACTDITGFGLIGHASEMAAASAVTLEINAAAVPRLWGAVDLVEKNTPGGGRTNASYFGPHVQVADGLDPPVVQLLSDPQTSGGLLAAIDPAVVEAAVAGLAKARVHRPVVGQVAAGGRWKIVVR